MEEAAENGKESSNSAHADGMNGWSHTEWWCRWGPCGLGEGEVKWWIICHNTAVCCSFCIRILYVCNQMIGYGGEVSVTPKDMLEN